MFAQDKSLCVKQDVMLIEVPDPEDMIWVVVAFLVGFFGFCVYYWAGPRAGVGGRGSNPSRPERLEYYERQLIDMKIRLDAMHFRGNDTKNPQTVLEEDGLPGGAREADKQPPKTNKPRQDGPPQQERLPNMASNDMINHVLGLITDKPMTSRDIQITLGRSREHTSRLMKRLFEDGHVSRNNKTKPFTYSITDKGRERVGSRN